LLIDPDNLTLKSGTKDPIFGSFHAKDNQFVLNIIDIPGLFERSNNEIDIRDNESILKTIGICTNQQDIEALKLLVNYLDDKLWSNAYLIITSRCESKNEEQRVKMRSKLLEDVILKRFLRFLNYGHVFFRVH